LLTGEQQTHDDIDDIDDIDDTYYSAYYQQLEDVRMATGPCWALLIRSQNTYQEIILYKLYEFKQDKLFCF